MSDDGLTSELDRSAAWFKAELIDRGLTFDELLNLASRLLAVSEVYAHKLEVSQAEIQNAFSQLANSVHADRQSVRKEIVAEAREVVIEAQRLAANSRAEGVEHGKSIAPRRNALKRHAEHHAMKADVFAWLDSNMSKYRSMDAAAEAVVGKGKVVPVTVRTARVWITEWKKLRAAGTP